MEDVTCERLNPNATAADLSAHNTVENPTYPTISKQLLPIIWELHNCSSRNLVGAGLQVISLGGDTDANSLILDDCDFEKVAQVVTVGSDYQWKIGGTHAGAIRQSGGSGEVFPDTGKHRWLRNNSGGTLMAGRFVKRTGTRTVAYAGPGEAIYGWLPADIADGADGVVVIGNMIADNYITGASAGSGQWGLAANGLLDYGAGTKLGSTFGNVVQVGF
jgi:hypothetical protein